MRRHVFSLLALVALIAAGFPQQAFADGNEVLGSISVASGTDILAAGVGLAGTPPGEGTINLNVPADATVKQVLLYWQGRGNPDDTALLNGSIAVTGDLIGVTSIPNTQSTAYRKDITNLNLIIPGPNALGIDEVDFGARSDGAMLLVIVDDGGALPEFSEIRDGMDFAFVNSPGDANVTVPQTFTFPADDVDRNGWVLTALGDGTADRQDRTDLYVGGDRTFLCNLAQGADGPQWDTNFIPVRIPANETSVAVQLFSRRSECPDLGTIPDSLSWIVASLMIEPPPEEPPGACWMTGGGVKFEQVSETWSAEVQPVTGKRAGTGPKDSVGGVVFPSCSGSPGNGGNWNHVSHKLKLHLLGKDIHTVSCGNVDGIDPGTESPVCLFNYIQFEGTGEVRGINGNKMRPKPVSFFGYVEDRNEPGNEHGANSGEDIDRYFLRVVDSGGNLVLLVDSDGIDDGQVDPLTITGGNFQIHCSSCDE